LLRPIRRVYGVARDSLNGLTDTLRERGTIDWIHTRHEETAALATGAEAHLTGTLAGCSGSAGRAICISSTGYSTRSSGPRNAKKSLTVHRSAPGHIVKTTGDGRRFRREL
jgi:hypothetical protein